MNRSIKTLALSVLVCNTMLISMRRSSGASEDVKLLPQTPVPLYRIVRQPTIQNFDDQGLVVACLGAASVSGELRGWLWRACPNATRGGVKDVSLVLAAAYIKARGGAVGIDDFRSTTFPCTNLVKTLKLDAADPEFTRAAVSPSGGSPHVQQESSDKLKIRPSLTRYERERIIEALEHSFEEVASLYRNYKLKLRTLEIHRENFKKLKAAMSEVLPSLKDVEKIKMESEVAIRNSDISEGEEKCKQFRSKILILVGTETMNRIDEFLNPPVLNTQ